MIGQLILIIILILLFIFTCYKIFIEGREGREGYTLHNLNGPNFSQPNMPDMKKMDQYLNELLQQTRFSTTLNGPENQITGLELHDFSQVPHEFGQVPHEFSQVPHEGTENFQRISSLDEKNHIQNLTFRADDLLDDLINNPIPGTDPQRWRLVKDRFKTDIKGLSFIEQMLLHQFAYTVQKGKKVRLCTCDENGEVDRDVNFYVLVHEITHIYDSKYLSNAQSHDKFFWVLFSKLIKRSIGLGLLDKSILNSGQNRCGTDIIQDGDNLQIEMYSTEQLPAGR